MTEECDTSSCFVNAFVIFAPFFVPPTVASCQVLTLLDSVNVCFLQVFPTTPVVCRSPGGHLVVPGVCLGCRKPSSHSPLSQESPIHHRLWNSFHRLPLHVRAGRSGSVPIWGSISYPE